MTAIVCIFKFLGNFWVGGFFLVLFVFKVLFILFGVFLHDLCTFLVLFGKEVDETPGLKHSP